MTISVELRAMKNHVAILQGNKFLMACKVRENFREKFVRVLQAENMIPNKESFERFPWLKKHFKG